MLPSCPYHFVGVEATTMLWASIILPMTPPELLAECAGDYEHPGYGRITIDAVGDALHWRFHGLSGEPTHRHYDVFEVPEILSPDLQSPLAMIETAISAACPRRWSRWSRTSCSGASPGATCSIRRSGNPAPERTRTARSSTSCAGRRRADHADADGPAGQPTYLLVPYQNCTFTIKELEDFRVEFQRDEAGVGRLSSSG